MARCAAWTRRRRTIVAPAAASAWAASSVCSLDSTAHGPAISVNVAGSPIVRPRMPISLVCLGSIVGGSSRLWRTLGKRRARQFAALGLSLGVPGRQGDGQRGVSAERLAKSPGGEGHGVGPAEEVQMA